MSKGTQLHMVAQGFEAKLTEYKTSTLGFLGDSDGKESACNARDLSLTPGTGRSPGEGNAYPLQYPCLENSTDRGAWHAAVHGAAKSQT